MLQGVGGAFLFANAAALVTDAFPRSQLGVAMGTNTMVAAVGLVLGGALVAISWPWVFWFNVPFGLLGAAWGALVLRELARPDSVRGFDVPGTLTFVAGLTGLVVGISRGGITAWNDPVAIVSLIVAAVLLRAFVWIEARSRAPMLDLDKLAPLALGMLVASPLAGLWADRCGSRALSAGGMLVSAFGLAGMTTLGVHTPYWPGLVWLTIVGIGSGMFNSPNTAAMMGVVPAHRRGVAAGARMMLQNTGAVLSIAFVLAVITNAVPRDTLLQIFSGLASGLSDERLGPFIHNMHTALWVLALTSVVGAIVCLMRPAHVASPRAAGARPPAVADGGAA